MATRKVKRYDDGGTTVGPNANIDDDTRARAMKWVQEQADKDSEESTPAVKTRTTTKLVKTKAEPKAESKSTPKESKADVVETKTTEVAAPRRLSTAEAMADLDRRTGVKPMDPNSSRGPNAADSTELGRNASALMSGMGPGKLVTGLSLAAREAKAADMAQKAYNARAAARRSEEGLSAAEAAVAKAAKANRAEREAKVAPRAAREAKTLNPNAWLSGPKGMREDFKKGGSVKGWGIARGARKAKTY